jgi:restriction system protein
MAIPDYESIMVPLLEFANDQREHHVREAYEGLAQTFRLTEEEKRELLPSGSDILFNNRVRWALIYLKKAGLVESKRRGVFKITQRGQDVLRDGPKNIDSRFLEQYPEFIAFKETTKKENEVLPAKESTKISKQTPEESLENSYQNLRLEVSQELLIRIKDCSPDFFEKLVIELLIKMGYGGSRKDAGEAIGKSGDGGIDGIIKEDKLGLDVIYIQAKRWQGSVGSREIRDFVGSLVGQKANKGIFITTSVFTKDALNYATSIPQKVILIDGEQLTQLMIDNDIGVSKTTSFEIKKIDSDYFEE